METQPMYEVSPGRLHTRFIQLKPGRRASPLQYAIV